MTGVVFQTHRRLLLRNWAFWILLAGSVGLAVSVTQQANMITLLSISQELVYPFILLGHMLITTAAAHRESADRVDELVTALPYRAPAWVLGRFLVHYLAGVALTVVVWLVNAIMVVRSGHPLDPGLLATMWVVAAPLTLVFTTAVSLAVGHFVSSVAAYFLTALIWIFGPFMMILLSKGEGVGLPVPLFEYFASGRVFPAGPAGYFPNTELLFMNRAFILALGIALVALLTWRLAERRGVATRGAVIALAVCLAVCAGTGARAQWIWSQWNGSYERELATLQKMTPAQALPTPPLRTDRYEITVSLDPAKHRLEATASFDVINGGGARLEQIDLTLRDVFSVASVTDASGRNLNAARDGHYITVPLALGPGEKHRLTLSWSGEVWQWRISDGPKLAAHVAENSVLLPANFAWYPIPGRHTLAYNVPFCTGSSCTPRISDQGVAHPLAEFQVKVSGSDLHLVTNAEHPVTGLAIVGTPYQPQEMSGMQVAVSPLLRERTEYVAESLAKRIRLHQELVPKAAPPTNLVELPDAFYYGQEWRTDENVAAAPGILLIQTSSLGRGTWVDAIGFLRVIESHWWPMESVPYPERFLFDGMTLYMMERYRYQDRARYSPGSNEVLALLKQIEEKKGLPAVARILREMNRMVEAGGVPTVAEFNDLVTAEAGDLPEVKELLAKLPSGMSERP